MTTPSQAEQQVFRFFVNKPPPGHTGSGSSFVGPGCDKDSGGQPGCMTFNTTSSQAGAMSEASSIGIGTQGHAVVNTLNDAFDGYGELQGGTTGGGGSPNAPTVSYGGLTVTRQVETTLGNPDSDNPLGTTVISASFVAAGIHNAERSIETFTNNTASTIDTIVSYNNNLGSDSNTHFVTIGANNTFVTSQQLCPASPPTQCSTDPTITQVLGNNAYTASNVTAYHVDGDDNPVYAYHLVIAPGQTVSIATFVILTGDINRGNGVDANSNGLEDAVESDIALGQTLAQLILTNPGLFLSDLTALQRSEIVNFNLCTTIDLSKPSFPETDCAAQANPMVFDGGTLKPLVATTFSQPVTVDATGGTIDNSNGNVTMSGVISGPGGLTFQGTHTTILSNTNTYTGASTLNSGVLEIDGSIATSTLTVNGGTVQGNGTLGTTVVNSTGTISPGNGATNATLTVTGNLTMHAGSTYSYNASTAGHDLIAVSGTATLNGTVVATAGANTFAIGQSIPVLTAGTVSGTFGALTTVGFNGAMKPVLTYTGTSVSLLLAPNALTPTLPGDSSINEHNVAGAVDFAVAHDNAQVFAPLFSQTGGQLEGTLDQMSGEGHAEAAHAGFEIGGSFLDLMLDPTIDARGGVMGASGPALAFKPLQADDQHVALSLRHAPRRMQLGDSQLNADSGGTGTISRSGAGGRIGVWLAGYGERDTADGSLPSGSHQVASSNAGLAGGVDFRLNDSTVFGVAAGYGHMGWDIPTITNRGKANVAQGGVYGSTRMGSLYLQGAFEYSTYNVTTARTLIFAGTNTYVAKFDANGYGGRLEAGDEMWHAGSTSISPYVAFNIQTFDAPGYTEATILGSTAFAQTVAAKTTTDTTSELGFKTDTIAGESGATAVHTTIAWVHDYEPNQMSTISFATLAGTSFIVHGAAQPSDSALVSIGLDTSFGRGFDIGARVSAKLSGEAASMGGTAALSYRW